MSIVEKSLMIVIVFLFILIVIGQMLVTNDQLAPFVNKSIQYEGVVKNKHIKVIETIDHNK
jgi:hypothetical protein